MLMKPPRSTGRFAEIALRLRAIRHYLGMTQRQVADEIGVDRQSISQWESGDFRISIDGALQMRSVFNISLDFIYVGRDDALPHKMATELRSILRDKNSRVSTENGDDD